MGAPHCRGFASLQVQNTRRRRHLQGARQRIPPSDKFTMLPLPWPTKAAAMAVAGPFVPSRRRAGAPPTPRRHHKSVFGPRRRRGDRRLSRQALPRPPPPPQPTPLPPRCTRHRAHHRRPQLPPTTAPLPQARMDAPSRGRQRGAIAAASGVEAVTAEKIPPLSSGQWRRQMHGR